MSHFEVYQCAKCNSIIADSYQIIPNTNFSDLIPISEHF